MSGSSLRFLARFSSFSLLLLSKLLRGEPRSLPSEPGPKVEELCFFFSFCFTSRGLLREPGRFDLRPAVDVDSWRLLSFVFGRLFPPSSSSSVPPPAVLRRDRTINNSPPWARVHTGILRTSERPARRCLEAANCQIINYRTLRILRFPDDDDRCRFVNPRMRVH